MTTTMERNERTNERKTYQHHETSTLSLSLSSPLVPLSLSSTRSVLLGGEGCAEGLDGEERGLWSWGFLFFSCSHSLLSSWPGLAGEEGVSVWLHHQRHRRTDLASKLDNVTRHHFPPSLPLHPIPVLLLLLLLLFLFVVACPSTAPSFCNSPCWMQSRFSILHRVLPCHHLLVGGGWGGESEK